MTEHNLNALPQGYRVLEYELVRVLGFGGFGMTYLGYDHHLDKAVAIKEYLPSEIAVRTSDNSVAPQASTFREDFEWGLERFLDEARTLARFQHPNIVQVSRFFEAHGTAYIVMEYAEGETLAERLARQGTLSEAELLAMVLPLLDGLAAVHEANFLHRDIKPGNIILRDADGSPVLLDFGSARQAIGAKSRSVTTVVTPGYAPIEQYSVRGNQGPWTDLYALGGVCYRALTSQVPDDATDRVRRDPLVPIGQVCGGRVSAATLGAIEWALQVDEEERPQSVAAWREALAGAAPVAPNTQAAAGLPKDRDRLVWSVLGLFLLIVVLGGYWVMQEMGPQPTQKVQQRTTARPAEDSRQRATARQAELERQRAAAAKQAQEAMVARQEAEKAGAAHRQAELERQRAAAAKQAQEAAARQAELERQRAAAVRQAEEAQAARRQAEAARQRREERQPGRRFKDCSGCPELVVVPAGSFVMGSPPAEVGRDDDEGPQRQVRIGYSLAVGVHEVTFAEWDACAAAGGCNGYRPNDRGWGRGRRPVINVSWEDAQAYVQWLSRKTGKRYRLLSEAEWEYVARAGTKTAFHVGQALSPAQANYKGASRRRTVAVGSFAANAYGLRDVHGNVDEWVQDCWNNSYARAPSNGSAWTAGDCSGRVLRGGSWDSGPRNLRSADRDWTAASYRSFRTGFRVARAF